MLQGKVEKGTRLWKEWKKWEKKYIYIYNSRYICNDRVTMLPPNATLSNGAARPLNPRAQYPMASTGSSYIKSKWCHLSSWFIWPYVRPQVLEGIIELCAPLEQFREKILLSAWQEKKCKTARQCETCQTRMLRDYIILCAMTGLKRPAQSHGSRCTLQHVAVSNCAARPLVGAQ